MLLFGTYKFQVSTNMLINTTLKSQFYTTVAIFGIQSMPSILKERTFTAPIFLEFVL